MAFKRRIDVLIVGAGPVGMTVALALAKQGRVELEIVDEAQARAGLSYALALHPSTLAILSDLGVADRLIAQGNPIERIAVYDGRERKLEMHVADLGGAFPYVLVLPQSAIEDALLEALKKHKVRVQWNHRLRHLDARGDDSVLCQEDQLGNESAGYACWRESAQPIRWKSTGICAPPSGARGSDSPASPWWHRAPIRGCASGPARSWSRSR